MLVATIYSNICYLLFASFDTSLRLLSRTTLVYNCFLKLQSISLCQYWFGRIIILFHLHSETKTFLSKEMNHGHFSNSFPRPGIDQHDNNHTSAEQPYVPTGRAIAPNDVPFVGSMNHTSRGGVHPGFHRNLEGRTNEYPSTNLSMGVQSFTPTFPGPNVDPTNYNSPIIENRSLAPVTSVGQHVNSTNYDSPSVHDMDVGLINCPAGNGGSLKRKRSGISRSCERGNLSSIYSAGSSSSSSQMAMEKPAVDCQSAPPYRGSLTIADEEDSLRNVRHRYRIDLEPTRTHVPNHSSHFYHSSNYSPTVQHPNVDANVGQWNCAPHYASSSLRRMSPSDSRHEMNRFHVGGSSADHHNPVMSRHPFSSPRNFHAPNMREGHANYSHRFHSPYGNGSRYSHYAHGLHATPRRGWHSSYRSGRPRTAVERTRSVVDVTESHDRTRHETVTMVNRAPIYGNSRNFSDQYRDLRLDIDNMSYEELLNLEERIGNVSTGLSEDSMTKCLREKVYYSSDQNHEEVSCPICLEEYRNRDKIGTMEKCGHEYHVECIKKWLMMKKLCPICKTECPNQEPCHG